MVLADAQLHSNAPVAVGLMCKQLGGTINGVADGVLLFDEADHLLAVGDELISGIGFDGALLSGCQLASVAAASQSVRSRRLRNLLRHFFTVSSSRRKMRATSAGR